MFEIDQVHEVVRNLSCTLTIGFGLRQFDGINRLRSALTARQLGKGHHNTAVKPLDTQPKNEEQWQSVNRVGKRFDHGLENDGKVQSAQIENGAQLRKSQA